MHLLRFASWPDVPFRGHNIRFFNLLDEYTKTALVVVARQYFKGAGVGADLEDIIAATRFQWVFAQCDIGS
ncbi:hypothetical protein AS038_08145 [Arthrobacter sp. NIO-1057]|nr:hypothetical protein AS038_08145 [Arthrobacter sp. NIO-1057]